MHPSVPIHSLSPAEADDVGVEDFSVFRVPTDHRDIQGIGLPGILRSRLTVTGPLSSNVILHYQLLVLLRIPNGMVKNIAFMSGSYRLKPQPTEGVFSPVASWILGLFKIFFCSLGREKFTSRQPKAILCVQSKKYQSGALI